MNEQPPILTPAVPRPSAVLGRLGRAFSFLALSALTVMMVFKPGWSSPISALGGLALMAGTVLGLILSLVGLLVDKRKSPAVMGLIITGSILVVGLGIPLLQACLRR